MDDTVSYWNKTVQRRHYAQLEKDTAADILIIGGGISGVTCAYCLAMRGANPVLIEEGELCAGTTGNTTGKVTVQHGVFYTDVADKYGMDLAKLCAESQRSALDFVKEVTLREEINCQFAEGTAYLFASDKGDADTVRREYEISKQLGIDAEYYERPAFPPDNFGMLAYPHQAVFHPVRYVEGLARRAEALGAIIYCRTKAVSVDDGDVKTVKCENGAEIRARHVVEATQYPIYDGPNVFFTRLYAKRAYAIAVDAGRSWPDGSYISSGDPTRSIRTHVEDGRRILIVAGETHHTARGDADARSYFSDLCSYADKLAGVNSVIAKWSAQDYDTPDKLPYIGRLSDNSNIYVAAGYKKWGMTSGTLAGMMLSELILDGNCRYEELYSRSRGDYSSSLGKVVTEVAGSVGELVRSKFEPTESIRGLKRGEGRAINFGGRRAGVYRGFDDRVTVLDISCTHLTTELTFNDAEKTWDCPAHGGRFRADDGSLIEGPPKDPLKVLYLGRFSDLSDGK